MESSAHSLEVRLNVGAINTGAVTDKAVTLTVIRELHCQREKLNEALWFLKDTERHSLRLVGLSPLYLRWSYPTVVNVKKTVNQVKKLHKMPNEIDCSFIYSEQGPDPGDAAKIHMTGSSSFDLARVLCAR
ncbi:hypothetical protein AOLI_G00244440 [Acnodon oligacanthus]